MLRRLVYRCVCGICKGVLMAYGMGDGLVDGGCRLCMDWGVEVVLIGM